jgi:hypothetical protein
MTIAYLISAHTDPQHLKRLIEALPEGSHFFIHIDKKKNIGDFSFLSSNPCVHFLSHRVDVAWGSINEVEYQMAMVKAALNYPLHFDRLVTISGLDYPLWGNHRIEDFFSSAPQREFIMGMNLAQALHEPKAQIYREYRFLNDKLWTYRTWLGRKIRIFLRRSSKFIGIKKPLSFVIKGQRYDLFKGAAWWAITEDAARFVLCQWENNQKLVDYFRTSHCPAETFAQTVLYNNREWGERCMMAPANATTLKEVTPLTYIDYDPVVKVLTEEDLSLLLKSDKMFCRKTMTGVSDLLLNDIDQLRKSK